MKPEPRLIFLSTTARTFFALWYFSINTSPITRNGGKLFQHVFIKHDPLTPWHLHSVRSICFTNCKKGRLFSFNSSSLQATFVLIYCWSFSICLCVFQNMLRNGDKTQQQETRFMRYWPFVRLGCYVDSWGYEHRLQFRVHRKISAQIWCQSQYPPNSRPISTIVVGVAQDAWHMAYDADSWNHSHIMRCYREHKRPL